MTTLAHHATIDDRLTRAGFLPTTPWWHEQLGRFYGHPTARTFVGRVGRAGIKSTTAARFACAELTGGEWHVPPGERHWFVFVSVRSDEAMQRLVQIEAMLRALGIGCRRADDKLELEDLPLGVKVLPATIGAVSGYRCIGAVLDEAAKWRSADSSANPAREVHASVRAMRVTHPTSRELIISSPFGTLDHHFALVERGDTDDQIVAIAPTWVANPSISEGETRRLEPDERVWLREYAAIPQAEACAAWPSEVVQHAFRSRPDGLTPAVPFGVDDPSSGRRDAWVSMVARMYFQQPEPEFLMRRHCLPFSMTGGELVSYEEPALDAAGNQVPNPAYTGPRPPLLVVEHVESTEGAFWRGLPASELVKQRAAMYRARGVACVFGDQREAYLLESAYRAEGIRYMPLTWTPESKPRAVERLRRLLAQEALILPPHDRLRRELLSFQEKILPSGHITFEGRSTDDHVAALVTLALADCEGLIPSSPIQRRRAGPSMGEILAQLPDYSGALSGDEYVQYLNEFSKNNP